MNQGKSKEAELVRKADQWFFHLVLDLPETIPLKTGQAVAIDLGENVLAATSTGKLFGGGALRAKRDRFLAHRKRLQGNGSQAAKQQLRYISGRENRAVLHLKQIRERIKAGKKMRSRLHRWSFDQLRGYIEYKAQAVGIEVVYVKPSFTSQLCSSCYNLGARIKHRFSCSACGSLQHSDLNASRNILRLGLSADRSTGDVNHRHVAAFSGQ